MYWNASTEASPSSSVPALGTAPTLMTSPCDLDVRIIEMEQQPVIMLDGAPRSSELSPRTEEQPCPSEMHDLGTSEQGSLSLVASEFQSQANAASSEVNTPGSVTHSDDMVISPPPSPLIATPPTLATNNEDEEEDSKPFLLQSDLNESSQALGSLRSSSGFRDNADSVNLSQWIQRDVYTLRKTFAKKKDVCVICGFAARDQLRRHVWSVHGNEWRRLRLGSTFGTGGIRTKNPQLIDLAGRQLVAAVHILAGCFDYANNGHRKSTNMEAGFDTNWLDGEKEAVTEFVNCFPTFGSPGAQTVKLTGGWAVIEAPLTRWLDYHEARMACQYCGKLLTRPDAKTRHEKKCTRSLSSSLMFVHDTPSA